MASAFGKSDNWGVGYLFGSSEAAARVAELFAVNMPHGGGIDYDWGVYGDNEKIVLSNAYHRMDEMGGYYDSVPFVVTIPAGQVDKWELEISEDISGLPYFDEDGYNEALDDFEMDPTRPKPVDENFMGLTDPEDEKQRLQDYLEEMVSYAMSQISLGTFVKKFVEVEKPIAWHRARVNRLKNELGI